MAQPVFIGSKKQRRAYERDERRRRALDRRLQQIYALSRELRSEAELDLYLQQIPDDAVRAETKKLIEPFCLFKFRKVTLATDQDVVDLAAHPEKATREVLQ